MPTTVPRVLATGLVTGLVTGLARAVPLLPAALVVPLAVPALAGAQVARGTVTGRVTDASTQQPVANAQVVVVGTQIGALTNADGRFTLRALPAAAQAAPRRSAGRSRSPSTSRSRAWR